MVRSIRFVQQIFVFVLCCLIFTACIGRDVRFFQVIENGYEVYEPSSKITLCIGQEIQLKFGEYKTLDEVIDVNEEQIDLRIPEDDDQNIISFIVNSTTVDIKAVKEGELALIHESTDYKDYAIYINVVPFTYSSSIISSSSISFGSYEFIDGNPKIELLPIGSSTDGAIVTTHSGKGTGTITPDNELLVDRPGHYKVTYQDGNSITVDVSLTKGTVIRPLRPSTKTRSFSQILRSMSNVVKASSPSVQKTTQQKMKITNR